MKISVLLILVVFASENENDSENDSKCGKNPIVVKIEEDEYAKKKSKFIGVSYHKITSKWIVHRWSKIENKNFSNGYYDDEETAAHASDTLARKLMENGRQKLKLNFPDDHTEVYPEKSSKFIGVTYHNVNSKWRVLRWSKTENKTVYNGCYDDEETAAHASDTLARKLMENGKQNLKLNFPNDHTEVYSEEKSSKFFGVSYNKNTTKCKAQIWNISENKLVTNACYNDEETAAHASDTLARTLKKNGKQNLKLNFPDDHTEVYQENQKKRKRPKRLSLEHPQIN